MPSPRFRRDDQGKAGRQLPASAGNAANVIIVSLPPEVNADPADTAEVNIDPAAEVNIENAAEVSADPAASAEVNVDAAATANVIVDPAAAAVVNIDAVAAVNADPAAAAEVNIDPAAAAEVNTNPTDADVVNIELPTGVEEAAQATSVMQLDQTTPQDQPKAPLPTPSSSPEKIVIVVSDGGVVREYGNKKPQQKPMSSSITVVLKENVAETMREQQKDKENLQSNWREIKMEVEDSKPAINLCDAVISGDASAADATISDANKGLSEQRSSSSDLKTNSAGELKSRFQCVICQEVYKYQKAFYHHLKYHYEPQEKAAKVKRLFERVKGSAKTPSSASASTPASVTKPPVTTTTRSGRQSKRKTAFDDDFEVDDIKPDPDDLVLPSIDDEDFDRKMREGLDKLKKMEREVGLVGKDGGDGAGREAGRFILGDVGEEGGEKKKEEGEKKKPEKRVRKRKKAEGEGGEKEAKPKKPKKPKKEDPTSLICSACGKKFANRNAVYVHMRIHNDLRPYKCDLCPRSFRQSGDVKYHKQSKHSTKKDFQCEFCGKEFSRKYSLVVHRKIHTGEKSHRCDFCSKMFRAANYLATHRRIHTGEKPHVCDVCGHGFRVRSDMKRHRANVHLRLPKTSRKTGASATSAAFHEDDSSSSSGSQLVEYVEATQTVVTKVVDETETRAATDAIMYL